MLLGPIYRQGIEEALSGIAGRPIPTANTTSDAYTAGQVGAMVAAAPGGGGTGAIRGALGATNKADDVARAADSATDAARVANPPTEVSGWTRHGREQAMSRDGGRGVTDEAVHDAVANPVRSPELQPNGTFRYEGEDATVFLNSSGDVVTTWANGRKGLRHP